ncbi:MAG: hypothetical protein N3B10_14570, partial [Armatimonadetes bacterium]|nr:hypothetical protein [Armatimonadota bacterium]
SSALSLSGLVAYAASSPLQSAVFASFLLVWLPAVLLSAMEDLEESSEDVDVVENLGGAESGES